ncbi:MAG: DUF721 domain-containing protein [Candidatus Thiodiazotropha sp. (ex Monitilora ramsayi)]|nr:DUF721 domain-containing protein [Candidatus Thiodiazotropha sp. (ex Monitilora ramsayi)]
MKSVKQCIAHHTSLASLGTQLSRQKALTEQVRNLLPAPLNEQIAGAVIQIRTLTLWVSSPVWASRLRYLAPQLLKQLKHQGLILDRIHPRVLVPDNSRTTRQRTHKRLALSEESAETLRRTAVSLEDKPLREAMLRLSSHAQSTGQD